MPDHYGTRKDGTRKGKGFLGELKRPDGGVSTELSIGIEVDGMETEIPLLVPTLSQKQIDFLLQGNKATKDIVDIAVDHAYERWRQGKSQFASDDEDEVEDEPY